MAGETEYGVFDENASGASFIETGILKTLIKTFAVIFHNRLICDMIKYNRYK